MLAPNGEIGSNREKDHKKGNVGRYQKWERNSIGKEKNWKRSVPWPPGYMQRKARPSSSACTRPAGVNSPPHFNTSSKDGFSLRVSAHKTNNTKSKTSHGWINANNLVMQCDNTESFSTFFLTGSLRLPVGKVSQLHFPVYPREMAIPMYRTSAGEKTDTRDETVTKSHLHNLNCHWKHHKTGI